LTKLLGNVGKEVSQAKDYYQIFGGEIYCKALKDIKSGIAKQQSMGFL